MIASERTSRAFVAAAVLAFALVLPPQPVHAQAACESAAVLSPAMSAAPAVGVLGEALAGVFERADTTLDQAIAGNPGGATPSGDSTDGSATPVPAPTPRPSAESNLPGPLVVGC